MYNSVNRCLSSDEQRHSPIWRTWLPFMAAITFLQDYNWSTALYYMYVCLQYSLYFVTTCHWAWKTNGAYYVDFVFWKFFLPSFCLNAWVVVAPVVVVGGGGSLSLLIIRLLWSVPGNNVSMSIATSAASSSLQLARHYIKNDANKKIEIIVV